MIVVLTVIWLMTQFYAVPFFMAQEKESMFLAFRNGLYMAIASLPYTLVLMILVALLIMGSVRAGPAYLFRRAHADLR